MAYLKASKVNKFQTSRMESSNPNKRQCIFKDLTKIQVFLIYFSNVNLLPKVTPISLDSKSALEISSAIKSGCQGTMV